MRHRQLIQCRQQLTQMLLSKHFILYDGGTGSIKTIALSKRDVYLSSSSLDKCRQETQLSAIFTLSQQHFDVFFLKY